MNAVALADARPSSSAYRRVPHTVRGEGVDVLEAILAEDVQAVLWTRSPDAACKRECEALAASLAAGGQLRLTFSLDDAGGGLAPVRACAPTIADTLADLAGMVGTLAGSERVGLRVESMDRAMCPRFHVDRVGLRLLWTLRGTGTEFVDDAHVDRTKLGAGSKGLPDEASGLLLPGATVERVPPGTVAIYKGCAWPGNEARGAVHRSPAVAPAGERRLLVAIDPLG